MNKLKQSTIAGIFSIITIGFLTLLTYKTEFGIFLLASFGSSMVLLYGYPESPFAQPKNVFFGHLLTSAVGVICLYLIPLPDYILIPIAVGLGVGLMILFNVTHPPAGGNPVIIIIGGCPNRISSCPNLISSRPNLICMCSLVWSCIAETSNQM